MEKGNSIIVTVGTLIVIGLLLVAAIYYATNKKEITRVPNKVEPVNAKLMEVRAENDNFEPSEISIVHRDDVDLKITAVDKDYIFKIEGYPRLDTEIKQGETKTVQLYALGVGDYEYTCGENCAGKMVVIQEPDTGIGAD